MSLKKIVLMCSLCAAGAGPICEAQEWDPVTAGPVTTWTAPLCEKGAFVFQPFFFFNRTRGTFDAEGDYHSLPAGDVKVQYQEMMFLQYGLSETWEIDAQAVYQQNYIHSAGGGASASGIGDSYLFGRHCFFKETRAWPQASLLLQVKIPSGKYQKADPDKQGADLMGGSSAGSTDVGCGLILTKKIEPFIFHADAVFSVPLSTRVDGIRTRYGAYQNLDASVEYVLPRGFNLMLEGNGFWQLDRKENGRRVADSDIYSFTAGAGVGWSCARAQALLAYQRTVLGGNTDATDAVVMTVVFTF